MLLGSLYAGIAFSNATCAAVHALAYPIGKKECRCCLVVSMQTCLFRTYPVPWLTQ